MAEKPEPSMPTPSTSVMPASKEPASARGNLASQAINAVLAVPPIWSIAKRQARTMMIRRAERLGIPWMATVAELSQVDWKPVWDAVTDRSLNYPDNYQASFHGYDAGHLCWEAAFEFEVASRAVHAPLYPDHGADSDRALRQGYHDALLASLSQSPTTILDLHATVGLSSFALRRCFPEAAITGLNFSPHYLCVARYQDSRQGVGLHAWHHALPEATGLADGSFDLISTFLLLHEMPQDTTRRILREARRLVRPGGAFAVMDMNPACGAYQTMPAVIMTLLKSTEPFLDDYFALDLEQEIRDAGFDTVTSRPCSPRHRAVVARVLA
jgi:ubiquinone/menaquinone biosynthesis C-methylase UbiE